jgi:putative drug exporter of the RND superfamily
VSSIYKAINAAVNRDFRTVFPHAALLIMVMLALLLRNVAAPWYLMAPMGLGFGAALSATVLIFQTGQGHSGLMFILPMNMCLFVVAIATNYNILMIARLREEAREGPEPREAASMAVRRRSDRRRGRLGRSSAGLPSFRLRMGLWAWHRARN